MHIHQQPGKVMGAQEKEVRRLGTIAELQN